MIYRSRKMRFKRSDLERVTKNTAVGTLLAQRRCAETSAGEGEACV